MGENEDVITLLDEEGTEHEFNIVDVLEVSDQRYAILQPLEAGEDPDTAVIFRMEGDALVTIEDDAEFERVRQAFEADAESSDAGTGLSSPAGGDRSPEGNGAAKPESDSADGDEPADLPPAEHDRGPSH